MDLDPPRRKTIVGVAPMPVRLRFRRPCCGGSVRVESDKTEAPDAIAADEREASPRTR